MAARPPTAEEARLLERAASVARHAYAPYSGFRVGALVVGGSGGEYAGVNVENASYPVGQCAESVALGALVTAGERAVVTVAVAAADGGDLLPCGACLQALAELGSPTVVARRAGRPQAMPLADLLTAPFAGPRAEDCRATPAGPGVDEALPGGPAPDESAPERGEIDGSHSGAHGR